MTTRMHPLIAAVLALGAACCAPAWSAAITQNTTDTDSISLSNLDGDETTEPPLVAEAAAKGVDAGERVASEAAKVPRSGSANATENQPAAKRTEPGANLANAATPNGVASSKQQQAQDQMFKQAALKGTPVGNPINARKYLKVDRATYLNGLNN